MSELSEYPWLNVEKSPAGKLAKELGHAVAVLRRHSGEYAAFDSWKPIPPEYDGWEVAWLVSASGKVVRGGL